MLIFAKVIFASVVTNEFLVFHSTLSLVVRYELVLNTGMYSTALRSKNFIFDTIALPYIEFSKLKNLT